MPRNSQLNDNEKGQISAYKLEGKSISFIVRDLSRSRTVVRNSLKDLELYGTWKRPSHPPIIPNAARRRLFREGQSSSRDLEKSQNLPIIPRRVRQLLHESPNLVYRNRKTVLALTAKHEKMRIDWVKKKVTWTMEKCETVFFFSGEKNFNLDGPDGSQGFWPVVFKKNYLEEDLLWFGELFLHLERLI